MHDVEICLLSLECASHYPRLAENHTSAKATSQDDKSCRHQSTDAKGKRNQLLVKRVEDEKSLMMTLCKHAQAITTEWAKATPQQNTKQIKESKDALEPHHPLLSTLPYWRRWAPSITQMFKEERPGAPQNTFKHDKSSTKKVMLESKQREQRVQRLLGSPQLVIQWDITQTQRGLKKQKGHTKEKTRSGNGGVKTRRTRERRLVGDPAKHAASTAKQKGKAEGMPVAAQYFRERREAILQELRLGRALLSQDANVPILGISQMM